MTTDARQSNLENLQERLHPRCRLCGRENARGYHLAFTACEDGSVQADVLCGPEHMGYEGRLHGGVVSSLLDSAMTNCLFSHGVRAFTAELKVRYHHPVGIGVPATVRAWREETCSKLHLLKAELVQNGEKKASASAKFMESRG